MKIRNGFVSNSSSSSFVLIGVYLTEEEIYKLFNITENDDLYETMEENGLDCVSGDGYDGKDGYYVGEYLSSDVEEEDFNLKNSVLKSKMKSIKSKFNKEPLLIGGMRAS